ncbi:TPA: helix-turn-helix transcriptional regulator [Vibrio cholerae]|nr:helix-turn-helix transcriptional regulator [Vibrio cholerae]HEQ3577750.1 helix-turn-helix transcriptional regulator [Vibrio cholerae]
MNIEIHPIVSDFKKEVRQRGIKYSQLATLTGISESKLKKIFSGRIEMTLSEYDSIRTALDIGHTIHAHPDVRMAIYSLVQVVQRVSQ